MKIKFVCNYNSDVNIYNIVNDIWNMDGEHDLTYGNDYTHLIIFNDTKININIDKSAVFGFIQEPYHHTFFDKNLPNKCNVVFHFQPEKFDYDNVIKVPQISIHHLWNKPFKGEVIYEKNNTKNILNLDVIKTKKLSLIINNHKDVSTGVECNWHKRQDLAEKLLNSDIDFDMYGIDWQTNDRRFKGYLLNKIDGLKNYKYNLSLENASISGQISEKFVDPILCNTIPIFNGHRDIDKYYGNSYEYLDYGDGVIDRIREIINSDKDYHDYDIVGAKQKFLKTYNPINIVKNYINNNELFYDYTC